MTISSSTADKEFLYSAFSSTTSIVFASYAGFKSILSIMANPF